MADRRTQIAAALGTAVLALAGVAGAVVVPRQRSGSVAVGEAGAPLDATTTSSSLAPAGGDVGPGSSLPEVTTTAAPVVSIVPVAPQPTSTTATTVAPTTSTTALPLLATDPTPCASGGTAPAAGAPLTASGTYAVALASGAVISVAPDSHEPAWRRPTGVVVRVTSAGHQPGLCEVASDGTSSSPLPTPAGSGPVALTADGGSLAVRSVRAPGREDLVTGPITGNRTVALEAASVGDPTWAGTVVVACVGGALVSVPAAGGATRTLQPTCPAGVLQGSPDGRRVAWTDGAHLQVLELATLTLTTQPLDGAPKAAPSWGPGSDVVYAVGGGGVVRLDLGATQAVVLQGTTGASSVAASPLGTSVAFVAGGVVKVASVEPGKATAPRSLVSCQQACSVAPRSWSPDGADLAVDVA